MTDFKCLDCNLSVEAEDFDMVILPDSLWLSIAKAEDLLCHKCIENRLGRALTIEDFPDKKVTTYLTQKLNTLREIPCNIWFFDKHKLK